MHGLPEDTTDILRLADWLEIAALVAPDGNSSLGDLERALRAAAPADIFGTEAIEQTTLEVLVELEDRADATENAYPFDLSRPGVIKVRASWNEYTVYVFCLCLSYYGFPSGDLGPRLFEHVAAIAAKNYLSGDSIRFGFPRDPEEIPVAFGEAIDHVCIRIGEGGGFRKQPVHHKKDDGLDVIAWKYFVDGRSSKVVMFGQCAAGSDWNSKAGELNVDSFRRQWLRETLVSPLPLRSFFCPHRIDRGKWELVGRNVGVVFERCRVANLAHGHADFDGLIDWIQPRLDQVSLSP